MYIDCLQMCVDITEIERLKPYIENELHSDDKGRNTKKFVIYQNTFDFCKLEVSMLVNWMFFSMFSQCYPPCPVIDQIWIEQNTQRDSRGGGERKGEIIWTAQNWNIAEKKTY